jgi:hypothetical protein
MVVDEEEMDGSKQRRRFLIYDVMMLGGEGVADLRFAVRTFTACLLDAQCECRVCFDRLCLDWLCLDVTCPRRTTHIHNSSKELTSSGNDTCCAFVQIAAHIAHQRFAVRTACPATVITFN